MDRVLKDNCSCGGEILIMADYDIEEMKLYASHGVCTSCLKEIVLQQEPYWPFVEKHCKPVDKRRYLDEYLQDFNDSCRSKK